MANWHFKYGLFIIFFFRYMNFFPLPKNSSANSFLFEKSATYFDGELVPKRAHALLPHAKLVSLRGLLSLFWNELLLKRG